MGLCDYGQRCWNSHELTEEQVERAIAAEKGRKRGEDSDRKRNASRSRKHERETEEEKLRNEERNKRMEEDKKRKEFLEVYKLWEETQRKSKD